jgi:hypothetical protein
MPRPSFIRYPSWATSRISGVGTAVVADRQGRMDPGECPSGSGTARQGVNAVISLGTAINVPDPKFRIPVPRPGGMKRRRQASEDMTVMPGDGGGDDAGGDDHDDETRRGRADQRRGP